ncbi:hypothetical protein V8D89_010017 [Ganoderma adspersum]
MHYPQIAAPSPRSLAMLQDEVHLPTLIHYHKFSFPLLPGRSLALIAYDSLRLLVRAPGGGAALVVGKQVPSIPVAATGMLGMSRFTSGSGKLLVHEPKPSYSRIKTMITQMLSAGKTDQLEDPSLTNLQHVAGVCSAKGGRAPRAESPA